VLLGDVTDCEYTHFTVECNSNADDSLQLPFETVSELYEFELNLKVDEINESRLVNVSFNKIRKY